MPKSGPINSDQRACSKCWRIAHKTEFRKGRATCLECTRAVERERKKTRRVCPQCQKSRGATVYPLVARVCRWCAGDAPDPLTTKTCTACGVVKPRTEFYRNQKWVTGRCKPCHNATGTSRYCWGCERTRGKRFFGESRWNRSAKVNSYHFCMDCLPFRPNLDEDDVRYDYAFARDVLAMTKDQALEWMARGYRDADVDYLDKLVPEQHEPWKPDELKEAI